MQVYIKKYIYDDIYNTLLKYKTDYDIDSDTFEKFCKSRIKIYMKQINLKNDKIDNKYGCSSIRKRKILVNVELGLMVMVYNVIILLKKMIYVKHIIIC